MPVEEFVIGIYNTMVSFCEIPIKSGSSLTVGMLIAVIMLLIAFYIYFNN